MIEYLEKLVEEEKWDDARRYAEQLLSSRDNTPRGLLIIYYTLLTSNFRSARYEAAIPPGSIVVPLASELAEWDYYGLACITMGAAFYYLNQEQQALEWWLKYFAGIPHYKRAAREEALIWYNIGLAYNKMDNGEEASSALLRGVEVAERAGNTRFAHGIRHALIDVYLKDKRPSQVPLLLAQCGKYLRDQPDKESQLLYQGLRAKHALMTRRFSRARAVALKGLYAADGHLGSQSELHIVLAKVASEMGFVLESLGHALAAQSLANMCQSQYLASEATQIIYSTVRDRPDAVHLMNEYYLSVAAGPCVPKTY